MNLRTIAMGIALCGAAGAQVEKPSPIPSRNQKPTVVAPQSGATPKAAPKKENAPATSGESDRTTSPSGPNVGTACFYKPKADGASAVVRRAVHADLPIGTKVRVTNLGNNKSVVVTVSDHGDLAGRIISVSRDASDELGFTRAGTAQVRVEPVKE